jgi:Ran GTPase-activating protein (RanGAP) involved in mRNA processing and transport
MFNFESLETLDLSSNWFGSQGLKRLKDQFYKFTNLRSLNLSINRLCMESEVGELRDCLSACSANLEELALRENNMKDKDMVDFLAKAIS